MKLTQLSLFLENKPRQLRIPSRLLAEQGINILALALADTQQFGILRLIVEDWQRARDVLTAAGCVVNTTEVLALAVPDRPGGLDSVLGVIEQGDLNVEYMYACAARLNDRAVLIFRFEDPDAALPALQRAGVDVLGPLNLRA